ncbi:MAG: PEGA domain-containing protein [Nitrospirae bacterium]|nr:PEGA domain-containing protein [Nitrospirota bacterium]MDE3041632.1 PEGA domain-containing protein [Nitrospirota bacterium]
MLSSVRFSFVMLCLLVVGSFVSGCATMANTDQQIAVYTIPDGADVVVGDNKGVSPMSVTVPGGYSIPHSIQISKEGYQSQTVTIQRGFRTSSLVTDILPGILLAGIPLIVDLSTGDFFYVANTSYTVKLTPVATGANGSAPAPTAQAVGQTGLGKYDIR